MFRPALRILLYQFRTTAFAREMERTSFLRAAGIEPRELSCVDLFAEGPDLEHLRGVTAIILGGSPLSVHEVPHREELRICLKTARLTGKAMLGVCFGAQLMADLWGGRVCHDPDRKEFGTYPIELTDRGAIEPLFGGLPRVFEAQCAHHDRISEMPPGAVLLAKSERCAVQAFGYPGFDIYAVQFHPERSKEDYEARIAHKREDPKEDQAALDETLARLRDTALAERIVKNFVTHHARQCRPLL